MAAASLTVFVDGREIRVFGGNRRPVINEFELYKKMTKEQFASYHPKFSDIKLGSIDLVLKLNKR